MEASHKREIILLIVLILVFTGFFFAALLNLGRGLPVFGIGMYYKTEDYLIMILSFLSIARIFWAIVRH
jgi:hypothetical protein